MESYTLLLLRGKWITDATMETLLTPLALCFPLLQSPLDGLSSRCCPSFRCERSHDVGLIAVALQPGLKPETAAMVPKRPTHASELKMPFGHDQ